MDGRVYALISYATGKAVDVPAGNEASGAYLSEYTYSYQNPWQRWMILYEGGNDYILVDMNSKNLLSIVGSSSADNARAWTYADDGTTGQRFKIVNNGDGTFSFLSKCSNYTKALEVFTNGNMGQTPFTGASRQKFLLVLPGYVYNLQNVNSGKSLDVSAANTANGSDIAQYITTPESLWQRWCIKYIGNGEYKIMDMNSGKLLSISGSSTANKANCHIWADDGTTGQIFKIVQNSDGTLTFLSKCSGYTKALGVLNSGTANGDTVVQITANGSNNQKFRFTIEAESKSPEGLYIIKNGSITDNLCIRKNRVPLFQAIRPYQFDGEHDQIWEIVYDSEKYYKIVNKDENGEKLLTAPASYSNNSAVTLENEYSGTTRYRQLWVLTVKENGLYQLQSRYHDEYYSNGGSKLVLGFSEDSSGKYVSIRNDGVDTGWVLDGRSTVMYSIPNEEHDHISTLSLIESSFNGTLGFGYIYEGVTTPKECKVDMSKSRYFVTRSHGGFYTSGDDILSTGIWLSEEENGFLSGVDPLNACEDISEADMFTKLDLVVFCGCKTAFDTIEDNICEAMIGKGVQTVIGFEDSIGCDKANNWTFKFWQQMLMGKSVQDSVANANEYSEITAKIYGDADFALS